jgi:uncharacterized repeat protein (TIGR03806 family)
MRPSALDAGPVQDAAPEVDAWPALPAVQRCKPAPVDFDRLPALTARPVLPEISVTAPVQMIEAEAGNGWWIAEQAGLVRFVPVGPGAGLPALVLDQVGLVRELRGLAVATEGADVHLFVSAVRANQLLITRYTMWANTGFADRGSARVLYEQPDMGGGHLQRTRGGALLAVIGDRVQRFDLETWAATEPAWATGLVDPSACFIDEQGSAAWCVDGDAVVTAPEGGAFAVATTAPCTPLGGAVYRGLLYPELWGSYLYACGPEVRGVRRTAEGWLDASMATLDTPITHLTTDRQGRIYATHAEGVVRFAVTEPNTSLGLPRLLSETGCFDQLVPLRPSAELVPFEVNSPLWTDHAHKRRWVVLPPGETISTSDAGEWHLPVGALLFKDFAFEGADGVVRSAETRVMVRWPFGFSFHTYRWNAEGTDAELLDGLEAEYADLEVQVGDRLEPLRYLYPSRQDCQTCHNPRVSRVLGPSTNQLNRAIALGGQTPNQLDALLAHGVLDRRPQDTALVNPADEGAPLEDRVRAYLHANCSHCHRPDGWAPPGLALDLRVGVPFAQMGVCGVDRAYTAFGVPGELRIDPGNPGNSNLYQRMRTRGFGQMPLLGTAWEDPLVEPLFEAWIEQLGACP